MPPQTTINDALESVSQLSLDDQILLTEIMQKRIIEQRRKELARSVQEGVKEYHEGKTHSGNTDNLMKDIQTEP